MPASEPTLDVASADAVRVTADSLADLAALVRGGGRPGVTAEELADAFAAAMARLVEDRQVVVALREEGLFLGSTALWSQELLARRVSIGLMEQGLRAFSVEQRAGSKALRSLAVILTRDWKSQGNGSLMKALDGRRLPGVELDFSQAVSEAPGGGANPRALLEVLRSTGGESHPVLAPVLERLRVAMNRPADHAAAVRGAGLAARARLDAEVANIKAGRDISTDDIGRLLFEVIRHDPSGLQATDTFRLLIDHFEHFLRAGRPEEALALLRRPLTLLQDQSVPAWPHRDLLLAEVGSLYQDGFLARIVALANEAQDEPTWKVLVLLLGEICPPDRRATFARAAGSLQRGELRQAVADGMILSSDRPAEALSMLLAQAQDEGAAIALLGLSRVEVPALLEKILGRMDSPLPVVRHAALVALRKHRTPHTQERVRMALDDPDEDVRVEALRYVCVYRDSAGAPLVLRRLQSSTPSDREARALAIGFALLARQEAVTTLTRLAQDAAAARPTVARAALAGLASVGSTGQAAIAELVRTHPELRRLSRDGAGREGPGGEA